MVFNLVSLCFLIFHLFFSWIWFLVCCTHKLFHLFHSLYISKPILMRYSKASVANAVGSHSIQFNRAYFYVIRFILRLISTNSRIREWQQPSLIYQNWSISKGKLLNHNIFRNHFNWTESVRIYPWLPTLFLYFFLCLLVKSQTDFHFFWLAFSSVPFHSSQISYKEYTYNVMDNFKSR